MALVRSGKDLVMKRKLDEGQGRGGWNTHFSQKEAERVAEAALKKRRRGWISGQWICATAQDSLRYMEILAPFEEGV